MVGKGPGFKEKIKLPQLDVHRLSPFLFAPLLHLEAHRAGVFAVKRHLNRLGQRIPGRVFDEHARPSERLQQRPMPTARCQNGSETDRDTDAMKRSVHGL